MSVVVQTGSTPQPIASRWSSGFIIGPVYDSIFIIGAPLVALVLAVPLFALPASTFSWRIMGQAVDIRQAFIAAFIEAHLVLVYFRSHGNTAIFRTHPWRFTVIPIVLITATAFSPHLFGIVNAVAVWWDVYHSSLQTFGFGRIYDAKLKNSSTAGRSLDYWMNLFLYTGPVLAGAHFIDHILACHDTLNVFAFDGNALSDFIGRSAPDFLMRQQIYLTVAILVIGIPFLAFYLFSYYRLQQQGYQVSWQKVLLLVFTGCVSIYAWGFQTFFDAFWVMNFFHALQYFAIVFHTEQKNLSRLFRVDSFPFGKLLAGFWVVSLCMLYGWWASSRMTGSWMASLVLTTAIMHFWYDGFIWSVKKHQV